MTRGKDDYQLDHILLEFGGRNRGKPTAEIEISSYLSAIEGFESLGLPKAKVMAYQQDFILWENNRPTSAFYSNKRTESRSFSAALVRCGLSYQYFFCRSVTTSEAMLAVIEMKRFRWSEKGVDYDLVANGGLRIFPK